METNTELITIDSFTFLSEVQEAPTIQKKFQVMSKVLNQQPLVQKNLKAEMIKKGLNAGSAQDFDYVPISVIEEALRQIFFGQVDFIIRQSYRDLNSFIVVARIKYKNPVTNEYRTIDGIGAKSIQQDSGSKVDSFNSTMKQNGLEIAVGIAYSRAVKNAAKKLGKLFGGDLNRDEELNNITVYSKKLFDVEEKKEAITDKQEMP